MRKLVTALLSLFLILAFASPVGAADVGQGGIAPGSVTPYYGSYSTEVPIAVPGFHGLEPRLKLSYSSAGANGWLGVGWGLAGLSYIERVGAGGGTPRYDATDVYYLDGSELLPCTSQGGTHCTKVQNYARIVQDAANNAWYVYGTNGTKVTYQQVKPSPTGFKWAISRVEDTHGNVVTFQYWCDTGYDCYPDTITYNGTTVKFYSELRTDTVTYASGAVNSTVSYPMATTAAPLALATDEAQAAGTATPQIIVPPIEPPPDEGGDPPPPPVPRTYYAPLTTMRYRLKTIDVTVGGSRARSYKLNYTSSANSGRSLLTSVQQYGRDAVLDAAGTITGGSALPAFTLTYNQTGVYFGSQSTGPYRSVINTTDGGPVDINRVFEGDFNGDGKTDIAALEGWGYSAPMSIYLSNGDGTFQPAKAGPYRYMTGNTDTAMTDISRIRLGDFNGDGKVDIAAVEGSGSTQPMSIYLSNGDGTFQAAKAGPSYYVGTGSNAKADISRWITADFTGDGKTDIAIAQGWGNSNYMLIYVARGDGTFNGPVYGPYRYVGNNADAARCDTGRLKVGDFNGDGKMDLAALEGWNSSNAMTFYFANGDGTFKAGVAGPYRWVGGSASSCMLDESRLRLGDFNGDGKTDMAAVEGASGTSTAMTIYISQGTGQFATYVGPSRYVGNDAYANHDIARVKTGDFNGDGRTDLAAVEGWGAYTTPISIYLSKGNGTFGSAISGPYRQVYNTIEGANTDISRVRIEDFNGDGISDFAAVDGWGGGANMPIYLEKAPVADLATSVNNGIGGRVNITYKPSSAWSNTYLPPGMVVQTVASETITDGRGGSSTVNYQYAGGNYSATERMFLGFRRVTTVIDAAGNYSETYYHQTTGSISKPDYVYVRDAQGRIYMYSAYVYTESPSAPYTSVLAERWDYECNQSTSCRRTLVQFGYDAYGNVNKVLEWGDYDTSGDERTTIRGYVPNTTQYITGLPAYENHYAGLGTSGPVVAQTLYQYDQNTTYQAAPTTGDLTATLRWDSAAGNYETTQYGYDVYGNPVRETDPRGYATTTTFDPTYHTFIQQVCNALNQCTSHTWDTVVGLEASVRDTNGYTTSYSYDALGRKVQTAYPDGAVTRFEYWNQGDPNNQKLREIQPDGSADGLWSDVYQDGLGRVYKLVKEGGLTKEYAYQDASLRKWKESLWYGAGETPRYSVYAYDGAGRLQRETNPDGAYSETVYGVGYVAQYDELRHEKVLFKDAYGRVTGIREQNGGAYYYTSYQYDTLDNVVTATDAMGNTSNYTFSSLGRKLAAHDVDMGDWTYSYYPGGLLASQRDAKAQTTSWQYDPVGRPSSKTANDGQVTRWYYDEPGYGASVGRLTRASYPGGSESHTWNFGGGETAFTRCVGSDCLSFGQSYDAMGRLTAVTYPDGERVAYSYDSTGRMSGVGGYVTSMTWGANDQLAGMSYANGTTTSYSYDPNRLWLNGAVVNGPAGTIFQATYNYDPGARITASSSSTNASLNLSYAYDDLNRLTGVTGNQYTTWTYDAIGNITQNSALGSYYYGDPTHKHAVTQAGSKSYQYDADGNLLQGDGQSYTWDAENQLAAITQATGTTTFQYDDQGQRIRKTGPNGTQLYFGEYAEKNNGSLIKYYYAGSILVAKRDTAGVQWYHQDHLGSIRALSNQAGQKVSSYDYEAYGKSNNDFAAAGYRGFTDQLMEPGSSLIYMGARYYDSLTGRFISADSVVPDRYDPQSLNRYSYALNNPVNNTDPTGHMPVVAVAMTVASIVGTYGWSSWISWVAIAGLGLTAYGYFAKNELIASIGSILLGFVAGYTDPLLGGPWVGGLMSAGVAAFTSPISPLSDRWKQVVGWAWSAAGYVKQYMDAKDDNFTGDEEEGVGGPKEKKNSDMATEADASALNDPNVPSTRQWPTDSQKINSEPGARWGSTHKGLDIGGKKGDNISAAMDGKVIVAGKLKGYGKVVYVDHGNGVVTRYGHLDSILVKKGQSVSVGSIIGKMGNTGHSTGVHLHFELRVNGRWLDPRKLYH